MTLVTQQLLMLVLCGGLTNPEGDLVGMSYDGPLVTDVTWSSASGTGHPNASVYFGYDNHFRVSSIGVDSELPVLYSYDQDGYITNAAGMTVTRDAANGLLTGTSITVGSSNVITSRSHNDFGEAITINTTYQGGDLGYAFSYDADGRIDSRQETSGASSTAQTYEYDLRGRLTDVYVDSVLTYEYDYDANGNRVAYTGPEGTVAATYDAQDRLLTYGSNSYTYNDHGQLTSKTDAGGTTSYNYDELGNLLSVTLPDTTLIEYVIDALGRRVGKSVDGTLVRQWTYQDALNPVAEYDGSGTLIQQFVYATRMNVPDLIIRGGTTYRVIADQVGSVRRIVEVSTGAVAQEIVYSPFGKVLSDSSPGWQPFGFAGGLYDNDTRLVRFGARDYDAQVGRWTAKDPSGFGGGANFFAYAGNDPVNYVDPVGLSAVPAEATNDASSWIDSIDTSGSGWLARATNFSAGFGDTITGGFLVDGGLTGALRDVIGGNESVDRCSGAYGLGEAAGEEFLMAAAAGPLGKIGGKVARVWSKRRRVKAAGLPLRGKVRYIPPKGYNPASPLPRGKQHGYVDKFGNEWTKGPSRTKGEPFEWDVQRPDGTHWNVSMGGKITH